VLVVELSLLGKIQCCNVVNSLLKIIATGEIHDWKIFIVVYILHNVWYNVLDNVF